MQQGWQCWDETGSEYIYWLKKDPMLNMSPSYDSQISGSDVQIIATKSF